VISPLKCFKNFTCGNFSWSLEDFYTSLSAAEEINYGQDATTSLSVEDESIDSADENGPNSAGIKLVLPRQMMCMAYMLPDDHP